MWIDLTDCLTAIPLNTPMDYQTSPVSHWIMKYCYYHHEILFWEFVLQYLVFTYYTFCIVMCVYTYKGEPLVFYQMFPHTLLLHLLHSSMCTSIRKDIQYYNQLFPVYGIRFPMELHLKSLSVFFDTLVLFGYLTFLLHVAFLMVTVPLS